MAKVYTNGEFGVVEVTEIVEGQSTKDLAIEKIRCESEKSGVKNGNERIKTNAKKNNNKTELQESNK